MMTGRARIVQFGFILCLLVVLVSGTSIEPQQAIAKPVSTGGPDGNPYGTGDPTGDDVPSPTPKPTAMQTLSASAPTARTSATRTNAIRGSHFVSIPWNLYLSILIRLDLR